MMWPSGLSSCERPEALVLGTSLRAWVRTPPTSWRLLLRPIGATVARQIPVLKVTRSNRVSVTAKIGITRTGTPHRYLTLREWGARQDPAMSVEEVVAAKMADKRKVEITLEDIMDAVTPF